LLVVGSDSAVNQWRSQYGANGATASPGPPRTTYVIRDFHRGSAPGPRWGTLTPDSLGVAPRAKFLATPLAVNWLVKIVTKSLNYVLRNALVNVTYLAYSFNTG